MPSGSVSGFKSWHNGSPINSSSWANPNTIACGSSGYVGAVRFSISQSASSITISSSVYRRLSTGTMRAEIRTSELSNPTPSAVGADTTFSAPGAGSTASFTFSGSFTAGTYYVYITSDSAYIDLYASGSMSVSYVAGGGCTHMCELFCEECEGSCESGCQAVCQNCEGYCESSCEVYCQNCEGASCQSCEGCESYCEGVCQNCQGAGCQTCQTGCQGSCQETCESACQTSCQLGCQASCELSAQSSNYFVWNFCKVTAAANTTDTVVRGLWSGFVAGQEVLCAACNGYLWQLSLGEGGTWSKTACGTIDTDEDVFMFGFSDSLYLLNGSQYRVWNGTALTDVGGYRPLVAVSVPPEGGGTALEQVNKLTGARRVRVSPDGTATVFHLPEQNLASVDYVQYVAPGTDITSYDVSLTDGTVTIAPAPAEGTNSIEIGYSVTEDTHDEILGMRYAELYNGSQDTRVFVYGDGTNRCFYSGIDYDGLPRADYFPDLNVAHVGDENTPITAMIRHYDRLLCFKLDSAWAIGYSQVTLADGTVTAGFYVSPINRSVGNCAPGQAVLVENRPRTLDGRSVVEWKSTSSSGNINGDERNAERVSQRVDETIRTFDLETAKTFYDKYAHEYYVIGADGTALVHGIDADAWYVYTNFAARCLINYKDELYFGTANGYLRHFSTQYFSDEGEAIDAYWESGSMPFAADFQRKYSAMLWVGIRPDDNGYLEVSAKTDRKTDFAVYSFETVDAAQVPEMNRIKLKAKKFTYYNLILANNTADKTATVVSVDVRVRGTGYVR
ncbi:MAG TPA: hypothetical protein IAD33_00810 [Candidatus Scatomorpha gallistercoris]|nr:hypothetical protein [Candidatus Scatomorpha gallistercoris]